MEVTTEVHDYYLTQENGARLMEGIHVIRPTPTAKPGPKSTPGAGKASSGNSNKKKKPGVAKKNGERAGPSLSSSTEIKSGRGKGRGRPPLASTDKARSKSASAVAPAQSGDSSGAGAGGDGRKKKRKSVEEQPPAVVTAAGSEGASKEDRRRPSSEVESRAAVRSKKSSVGKLKKVRNHAVDVEGPRDDEDGVSVGSSGGSLRALEGSGSEGTAGVLEGTGRVRRRRGGLITAASADRARLFLSTNRIGLVGKVRRKQKRKRKLAVHDNSDANDTRSLADGEEARASGDTVMGMELEDQRAGDGVNSGEAAAPARVVASSKKKKRKAKEALKREEEQAMAGDSDNSVSTDIEQPWQEMLDTNSGSDSPTVPETGNGRSSGSARRNSNSGNGDAHIGNGSGDDDAGGRGSGDGGGAGSRGNVVAIEAARLSPPRDDDDDDEDGNGQKKTSNSSHVLDAVVPEDHGNDGGLKYEEDDASVPSPSSPPIKGSTATAPVDLTAVAIVTADSNTTGPGQRGDGAGDGGFDGVGRDGDGSNEQDWVPSIAPASEDLSVDDSSGEEDSPPRRLTISSAEDEDDDETQANDPSSGSGRHRRQGEAEMVTAAARGGARGMEEEDVTMVGVVSAGEDSERGGKADVGVAVGVKGGDIPGSVDYHTKLTSDGDGHVGEAGAAAAAPVKANVVPVLSSSSANDPHALEVARVLISGLGMVG